MHLAMVKIMVEVEPVWRRWPLTSSHIDSFCTSAISSLVTSQGPTGPKVSCDLPLVHWPSALDLEVALGDVVADAIAGDVIERVGLARHIWRGCR